MNSSASVGTYAPGLAADTSWPALSVSRSYWSYCSCIEVVCAFVAVGSRRTELPCVFGCMEWLGYTLVELCMVLLHGVWGMGSRGKGQAWVQARRKVRQWGKGRP